MQNLHQTLQRFLESVEPIVSLNIYQNTTNSIEKFSQPNGVGEYLQKLLKIYAENYENWLVDTKWWNNYKYLHNRKSIVTNTSPGISWPMRCFQTSDDWLQYAANIIEITLKYKGIIDRNELPVERYGKYLLDMTQYENIFGACRIPGVSVDWLDMHPNSRHIVVVFRNIFFKVQLYDTKSNAPLSKKAIFQQLLAITSKIDLNYKSHSIGILTTEQRDRFGMAYEHLLIDSTNRKSLADISQALFVLCLDKKVPISIDTEDNYILASHQLMHGGGSTINTSNRWFDKPIQIVINENGNNGIIYEHTVIEGQPVATLMDYILKELNLYDKIDNSKNDESHEITSENYEMPKKLLFNLSQQSLLDIETASISIDRVIQNIEINCIYFEDHGKEFIKAQNMSPDGYIQMAIQYAYYKLHRKHVAQYEPAHLRIFIRGRTEGIRSCTRQAIDFVQSMVSVNLSANEKIKRLRLATEEHKKLTQMALMGQGIERHFLGWKMIAEENSIDISEFYQDEGFMESENFILTTSQVTSKFNTFLTFGPIYDDRYAIAYNPRENNYIFSITSIKSCPSTNGLEYGKYLREALNDMQGLFK